MPKQHPQLNVSRIGFVIIDEAGRPKIEEWNEDVRCPAVTVYIRRSDAERWAFSGDRVARVAITSN